MKKATITTTLATTAFAVQAQTGTSWNLRPDNVMELLRSAGAILVLFMIGSFILYVIRQILDYRLKVKMIESGVPEQVIAQIANSCTKDSRQAALKWTLLLAGMGLGLLLIGLLLPLGLHSLMIMTFSISLAYYLYYFFTRKQSI